MIMKFYGMAVENLHRLERGFLKINAAAMAAFLTFGLCAGEDVLARLPANISGFAKARTADLPGGGRAALYQAPSGLRFQISVKTAGPGGFESEWQTENSANLERLRTSDGRKPTGFVRSIDREKRAFKCLAGKKIEFNFSQHTFKVGSEDSVLTLAMAPYRNKQIIKISFSAGSRGLTRQNQKRLTERLASSVSAALYEGEKTSLPALNKRIAVSLLKKLHTDPLNDGAMAAQTFIAFSRGSDKVIVSLDLNDIPWYKGLSNGSRKERYYALLLFGSFLGGNVVAQLERNVCSDMKKAGLESLEKTYRIIRAADARFSIPEFENQKMPRPDGS